MTFGQLLAFNVALLVAIASPGPALLMAIKTTLSGGRTAGIAVGAGLGLMAATWTLMALLGLGVAFYTTLAFCLSTEAVAMRYLKAKACVDRFASVVLGALGVRLFWHHAEVP